MHHTVLVAEGDRLTALQIKQALAEERHQVVCKPRSRDAINFLYTSNPDVMVIGQMDRCATEVCKSIRESGCEVPLICITQSEQRDQGIQMLRIGADDYITQPLNAKEMAARINRLIARPPLTRAKLLSAGNISLDQSQLSVQSQAGKKIELKRREFDILRCLVEHKQGILTRSQIASRISSPFAPASEDAIDVHVSKLRSKLRGLFMGEIQTVYGMGYRLMA